MTSRKVPKTARKGGRVPNEARRADGMRLLAEGMYVGDIARALRVNRHTVRAWQDSQEGQRILAMAQASRAADFENVVADARRALRELVPLAVAALRADLRIPARRGHAAREILNRTGLPSGTVVEIRKPLDLSKVSPATLAELEALAKQEGEQG